MSFLIGCKLTFIKKVFNCFMCLSIDKSVKECNWGKENKTILVLQAIRNKNMYIVYPYYDMFLSMLLGKLLSLETSVSTLPILEGVSCTSL